MLTCTRDWPSRWVESTLHSVHLLPVRYLEGQCKEGGQEAVEGQGIRTVERAVERQ